MSWNISFAAKGKKEAHSELKARAAKEPSMPEAAVKIVAAVIDALPLDKRDGFGSINVASYGHFQDDGEGGSNIVVDVQTIAD